MKNVSLDVNPHAVIALKLDGGERTLCLEGKRTGDWEGPTAVLDVVGRDRNPNTSYLESNPGSSHSVYWLINLVAP
jgi:hypothetical protein